MWPMFDVSLLIIILVIPNRNRIHRVEKVFSIFMKKKKKIPSYSTCKRNLDTIFTRV